MFVVFLLFPDVIFVSAAGSMLCQIINSLLLLPVSVARPLLNHLLDLLPPLDRLNRLLPAAYPLEDQELQWPLHGELWKSCFCFLFFSIPHVLHILDQELRIWRMSSSVQVHLTLLSLECPCLSLLCPGCGWWTWRGRLLCWLDDVSVGCFREPAPLWRNRTLPTGSKHRFLTTALKQRFLRWVGNAHSDLVHELMSLYKPL